MQHHQELIDNCFYVKENVWGTWGSHDSEGNNLVTSYNRDECISSTRYYLKFLQDHGSY